MQKDCTHELFCGQFFLKLFFSKLKRTYANLRQEKEL